jgi:hypothetical protein
MTPSPETVTITVDGGRYTITRTAGAQDGTVVERLDGVGLVFSERAWLGHKWASTVRWSAAVNPTGEAFAATARIEGLRSRRAAWRWLLTNAEAQR